MPMEITSGSSRHRSEGDFPRYSASGSAVFHGGACGKTRIFLVLTGICEPRESCAQSSKSCAQAQDFRSQAISIRAAVEGGATSLDAAYARATFLYYPRLPLPSPHKFSIIPGTIRKRGWSFHLLAPWPSLGATRLHSSLFTLHSILLDRGSCQVLNSHYSSGNCIVSMRIGP